VKDLKQYLLASAFCALPLTASAAPPTPFNWTGFYVGASVGVISQGTVQTDLDGDPYLGGVVGSTHNVNSVGPFLGINGGYNYQMGRLVLGIEADIALLSLEDTKFGTFLDNGVGGACSWGFQSRLSNLGTVRGRIGYAFDRTLIYATGGLAYGQVENNVTQLPPPNTPGKSFHSIGTKTGWAAGGGIEYAFANKWTVRCEGLYVDLGTSTVKANNSSCRFAFKNTYTIGRLGLNYKF
jgi:outer membrane immunogenic protein